MSSIDIILALVIVLCIIFGYRKGFMRTILPVAAFLLSIFLAYTLSGRVATYVSQTFVEPKLTDSITQGLNEGADSVKDLLPGYLVDNAERFGLNLSGLDAQGTAGSDHSALADTIVTTRIRPGLVKALSAVCAIVLFLVLSMVLGLVARLVGKTFNVFPLKGLNRLAGGALGLINGLILCALLCALIATILTFRPDGYWFITRSSSDESIFFRYFNDLLLRA